MDRRVPPGIAGDAGAAQEVDRPMRSPRVCAAIAIVLAIVRLAGQQPAPQTGAPAPDAQTFVPPNFIGNPMDPPAVKVPDGFAPIFNGRTLAGWHVSRTNHH